LRVAAALTEFNVACIVRRGKKRAMKKILTTGIMLVRAGSS